MSSEPSTGNTAGTNSGSPLYSGRGATPIPDPTILTSQALAREIAGLREILEARIEGDKRIIETRLDGMDKAISLLQETTTDKVSSKIVEHVSALKELHEKQFGERFDAIQIQFEGIQTQFRERDTRSERESRDNKVAVDAAFAAQKEAAAKQDEGNQKAIDKSETAMTEKVDKQGELFGTANDALRGTVSDIKDRLITIEGKATGVASSWSIAIALIGALLGVAGFAFAVTR